MLELGAPVRVSWDLPPLEELVRTVWRRLRDGRVLFLDVYTAPDRSESLTALRSERRAGGGPALTFTGVADALWSVREALGDEEVSRVELQLLPDFPRPDRAAALALGARSLTPALWCSPEGLRSFPAALALAASCGFPAVALLNPTQPAACLSARDREFAVAAWQESGLAGKAQLRVHDLFLAEALGLDPFQGYAGCQAGAYLAHVTAQGQLVACRTLPQVLGDLRSASLGEVWQSPGRETFRARVLETPEGCRGCALASACLGGCRGYAPDLGRDSSCPKEKGGTD